MQLDGRVLALEYDDIDTDQIIPATHLSVVDPSGLGRFLFTGHAELATRLAAAPGATIVVAGANFGCGSSREHAAWALVQRGFTAVIATSFSRIFEENAYTNGLIPIALAREEVDACARCENLRIDVEREEVDAANRRFRFALDPLRKTFLTEGGYLRYLHAKIPLVTAWKETRASQR